MHYYDNIDQESLIETPPDTYTPDKISTNNLEQLQQARNQDLQQYAPKRPTF